MPEARIAIVGARVFDGSAVLDDHTVVIAGASIEAVGPRAAVEPSANTLTVDGRGKTVTPGFIDMHTHAREHALPLWLAYGVTTVKDVGNTYERILPWRDGERGGANGSPRIYCCGPLVDGSPPFWPDHSYAVTSDDDAVAAADDLAAHGVDACKTYMMLPAERMRTFVGRAKEHGLRTTSHLGHVTASQAMTAGVSGFEHTAQSFYTEVVPKELVWHADERRRRGLAAFWANFVRGWASVDVRSDRAKRMVTEAARHEIFVNPTLVTLERTVQRGRLGIAALDSQATVREYALADRSDWRSVHDRFVDGWVAADFAATERALEKVMEFTGALHAAGVRLHCASDSPFAYIVPGSSFHRELQLLDRSGLGPVAALKAATAVAAATLGAADIGSVSPGAQADLLIFGDDVTERSDAVASLETVFKRGVEMDRHALLAAAAGRE